MVFACGERTQAEAPEPPQPIASLPDEEPVLATHEPSAPPIDTESGLQSPRFFLSSKSDVEVLRRIESAPLLSLRRFGHTSIGFRSRIGPDEHVAIKPRTVASREGWAADVAAFRLARVLGMDQVPPVGIRKLRRDELVGLLRIDSPDEIEELMNAIVWDVDGSVPCEVTPWVRGMRDADLEDARRPMWTTWLDRENGALPAEDDRMLARDISQTLLFDWLIRNVDRMTGGNMQTDASGKRLVVRDHNLAFGKGISSHAHRETWRQALLVERVSESFVEGLLRLDETWVREIARTRDGVVLLDEERIDGVLDRREKLVEHLRELGVIDVQGHVVHADFD